MLFCSFFGQKKEMAPHLLLLTALLALSILSQVQQAVSKNGVMYRTIIVDKSGHGDFTSIGSAIDSIPSNNQQWVCVYVKQGVYWERVVIPQDKPFILLRGDGRKKTFIASNDYISISDSATFSVMADNFAARGVSFVNAYNLPVSNNNNTRKPAVAAMIFGDKVSFYRCGFYGVQDTLWDAEGRHYFKKCAILGAVDFIFGAGQSIYEKCHISVLGKALWAGVPGFITAQGRDSPTDRNGFVFKECKVSGDGETYLGRPWRAYARVIFYKTEMTNVVVPAGWDPWSFSTNEVQLVTFSEHECYGAGADTSKRVRWANQLSAPDLNFYINNKYIDKEGWLSQQP